MAPHSLQQKLSVLIVEDSAMVAERIREMLNESGDISGIDEAINGTEAMIALETKTPDVVLLDINLPGKNGIEILREIKQKHLCPLVIMLTNCSDPYIRRLCKDLGADYFFDKSSEFEKVPAVLSSISLAKTEYTIPLPLLR